MGAPGTPPVPRVPQPSWGPRRLLRLARKELREILRDRRTIVTLVLMPVLLYPLLAIAFRHFFLSGMGTVAVPQYRLGVPSGEHGRALNHLLETGDKAWKSANRVAPRPGEEFAAHPEITYWEGETRRPR